MRRVGIAAVLALSLSTMAAGAAVRAAATKEDHTYGPPPDWAAYKTLGDAAVRAILPPGGQWRIDWPNGYKQGAWPMKGKPRGYVTCGFVRALGSDGGIVDSHPFAIIIDGGVVKGVDYKPHPGNSIPNLLCAGLNNSGAFPPPPSDASPASLPVAALGIEVLPMPEGAYVTKVSIGSLAANARLKPGMVVARVNAVPLGGLGEATAKVIGAAGPGATLTLIDGTEVKLGT